MLLCFHSVYVELPSKDARLELVCAKQREFLWLGSGSADKRMSPIMDRLCGEMWCCWRVRIGCFFSADFCAIQLTMLMKGNRREQSAVAN